MIGSEWLIAEIVLGAPDWLGPVTAALVAALVLTAWMYWRSPGAPGVRAAGFAFKALGLTALAAMLLEPLWTSSRPQAGGNLFALLADNSQSLQIADAGQETNRGDQLRRALTNEKASWLLRLAADFRLRRYRFDDRPEQVGNFAALDFSGRRSSLVHTLDALAARYRNQPLAGVLLFTDGLATDFKPGSPLPSGLPPVFPVLIGRDVPEVDVQIEQVIATQSEFEDAPVTLRVEASATGFDGERVTARLSNEAGKVIAEQSQTVADTGSPQTFRFQFRPEQPGLSFFRAEVGPADEAAAVASSNAREATIANNSRLVAVDRGRGPYRVLYVAGRPNWEHKFFARAIAADEEIQLVSLLRIARREPKFDFRGRGSAANPLYRGFDDQAPEEAERYDQPVLVRLNVADETELQGGFPKTAEELFKYHAIVLDDLEAEFFTADQQQLIERFVADRGGGLLMLGGQESLAEGDYAQTPLAAVLPVYLDRPTAASLPGPVRLELARDGWLQNWVRLRTTEDEERRRLAAMPEFRTINAVGRLKPGAVLLAQVTDETGAEWPALATQRFGRGRTAVFTVGDAWRWAMRREEGGRDPEKAWRQMIRWLVADTPGRVALEARPADEPGGAVRLAVQVRDLQYRPQDEATVRLTVRAPDGGEVKLEAEPGDEPGLYAARYLPRPDGAYRVKAEVIDGAGATIGKAETGWASEPAAEEFRSLKPDRDFLNRLARETGGEVVELGELDELVESLASRPVPLSETVLTPLWHQPSVFLFALGCLVAEWGLRRRRGLP